MSLARSSLTWGLVFAICYPECTTDFHFLRPWANATLRLHKWAGYPRSARWFLLWPRVSEVLGTWDTEGALCMPLSLRNWGFAVAFRCSALAGPMGSLMPWPSPHRVMLCMWGPRVELSRPPFPNLHAHQILPNAWASCPIPSESRSQFDVSLRSWAEEPHLWPPFRPVGFHLVPGGEGSQPVPYQRKSWQGGGALGLRLRTY